MQANGIAPLKIVYVNPSSLTPSKNNARKHSKKQIEQIAESIRTFGFVNPVLIDQSNTIVAGHGRVQAAKILGLDSVPVIVIESLSEDELRAFMLADNRLGELSDWDESRLRLEFQHFAGLNLDFKLNVIGFDDPEIEMIIAKGEITDDHEDDAVECDVGPPVCVAGDLWLLDRHRLICGNALLESDYARLMEGKLADGTFSDPPYNVRIQRNVCRGKKHPEFAMASGEMLEPQFRAFLNKALSLMKKHNREGSLLYLSTDWRHVGELLAAGNKSFSKPLNICVWVKDNGGLGSFYRSRHELVFVFRNGSSPHTNNVQLGKYGRNRTNVWEYPGANTSSRRGGEDVLSLHPTVKPVALIADAILDSTARNEIVLDAFVGSGSTVLAAERTGRICFGIEIEPRYVDTTIRRWQRVTGKQAVHAVSGKLFNDLEAL